MKVAKTERDTHRPTLTLTQLTLRLLNNPKLAENSIMHMARWAMSLTLTPTLNIEHRTLNLPSPPYTQASAQKVAANSFLTISKPNPSLTYSLTWHLCKASVITVCVRVMYAMFINKSWHSKNISLNNCICLAIYTFV